MLEQLGRSGNNVDDESAEVWSGEYTVVVPSELKRTIGRFASQFSGYQQQDSQEFMSFILDGIHESIASWDVPFGSKPPSSATFRDITGAQYPEQINGNKTLPPRGKTLLPIFKGGEREPHKELYWHFNRANAVRQGDLKLVRAGKAWELYDLKTDSAEKTNLAAKHPEIIQRLQTAAARATAELGNGEQQGLRVRPVGRATKPTPRIR